MSTKWTTLYKYVDLKYVPDILDNHRLYLNDGKNFNDPFEVTVTERTTSKVVHVDGLHILSLTNSFQNKLMWSHYANSHKGVCLTVKVPQHLVYPMCYSKKRVYTDSDLDDLIENSTKFCKRNINKSFENLSNSKKIAYIKDKKWLYEKEYRIVFDENDETGLIFENGKWFMSVKVTNVYLGVNFCNNDINKQEEIIEACHRNNISTKMLTVHEDNYSIKIKR